MLNYLHSKDARNMASFDAWSDHQDRNAGNMIRRPDGTYASIDHETVLHSILWVQNGTTLKPRSILSSAQKEMATAEYNKFLQDVIGASHEHAGMLSASKSDIEGAIKLLIPALAPSLCVQVTDMLEARSQSGWLAAQFGASP
jgi:hypothetical protein